MRLFVGALGGDRAGNREGRGCKTGKFVLLLVSYVSSEARQRNMDNDGIATCEKRV